jgi:outer membrane receptor for ferric coprogen and ferric-rhodotorulic acid
MLVTHIVIILTLIQNPVSFFTLSGTETLNRCVSATLLLASAVSSVSLAQAADEMTLPATQIQDVAAQDDAQSVGYVGRPSSSTTKLGLTNKETPQAITTITRDQINDYKMNSVKDALRSAPSVTV